jgi:hypothetical protein
LFLPSRLYVRLSGCPSAFSLSGLHRSNYFTGVIYNIPSCAHHGHIPLNCIKWPPELKMKNIVRSSQVILLVGFQPNFTGEISTILSCVHHRHKSLHCTPTRAKNRKIEKFCPVFTGKTTGGISTKVYLGDYYQPLLCTLQACSASLHKMGTRAEY